MMSLRGFSVMIKAIPDLDWLRHWHRNFLSHLFKGPRLLPRQLLPSLLSMDLSISAAVISMQRTKCTWVRHPAVN